MIQSNEFNKDILKRQLQSQYLYYMQSVVDDPHIKASYQKLARNYSKKLRQLMEIE